MSLGVCEWLGMQSSCGDYAWTGLEKPERLRTMAPILAPSDRGASAEAAALRRSPVCATGKGSVILRSKKPAPPAG